MPSFSNPTLAQYLGPNSYYGVLDNIKNKLYEAIKSTKSLEAKQLFESTVAEMNNTIMPMMVVRKFHTNAQDLEGRDITVKDVNDYIKRTTSDGDYNFLINVCAEEHLDNMNRAGVPNYQDTIKEFEEKLNEPSSVIEQGLKNGLFDYMKSNLLLGLKVNMHGMPYTKDNVRKPGVAIENTMFENTSPENITNYLTDNIVIYSPIGVQMQDIKNNRVVYLMENDCLSYDAVKEKFDNLIQAECNGNPSEVSKIVPPEYMSFMDALTNVPYNPREGVFSMNESWDFNLTMKENGETFINDNPIHKEDVRNLLMESITFYDEHPNTYPNFKNNSKSYMRDADRFLLLLENNDKLIKFDNLKTIRNLNESSNPYIIIDSNQFEPEIISSNKGNLKSNSFKNMFESACEILNLQQQSGSRTKVTKLFENQIKLEQQTQQELQQELNSLQTQQRGLNNIIDSLQSAQKVADINSPAYQKIQQKLDATQELLDANIEATQQVLQQTQRVIYRTPNNPGVIKTKGFKDTINPTPIQQASDIGLNEDSIEGYPLLNNQMPQLQNPVNHQSYPGQYEE